MSTLTDWKWSADPIAERAAISAWNDAANKGNSIAYCDAAARGTVIKNINDRADLVSRPEATAPPVVLLRGRFTMREVKAKLRAYEGLYGVKASVAVAGRWMDKGDPVVLAYERPHKVSIKGDTFEVVLSASDTCYVRPEEIDFAVFRLTPVAPKKEKT